MYNDYINQWFSQPNITPSNTSQVGFETSLIQANDAKQYPTIESSSMLGGNLNYKDVLYQDLFNANPSFQTVNNVTKRSRDDVFSSNIILPIPIITKGAIKKAKIESTPKDPKMLLHELLPNLNMSEVITDFGFKFKASIDDKDFEAVGTSKKLAKTNLACKILKEHLNINLNNIVTENESGINLVKYTPDQLKTKNPISLLHEINSGRLLKFDTKSLENTKIPIFAASLDYNGKTYSALGLSKNKAKLAIARKVLQECHSITLEATSEEVLDEERIAELQNKSEKSDGVVINLASGPILKSPLALLHELVRKKYQCVIEPCQEASGGFVAKFIYPDEAFQAWGLNKKQARNETAKVVLLHNNINYDSYVEMYKASMLEESLMFEQSDTNLSPITMNKALTANPTNVPFEMLPLETADTIAKMVLDKFEEITSKKVCNFFANKYMVAGIVIQRGPWEENNLEVLCVSNGSQCLSPQIIVKAFDIQTPPNTSDAEKPKESDFLRKFTHLDESLHDCHAEVLCRRALIRYIWLSLGEMLNDQDPDPNCILEKTASSTTTHPRFQVKPEVSFYFYMSNFPCGSQLKVSCKHPFFKRGRKGLPFNITNQGLIQMNESLRSPEQISGDMVSFKSCPINKFFKKATLCEHIKVGPDAIISAEDINDNEKLESGKGPEDKLSVRENEDGDTIVEENGDTNLLDNFGIISCADKIMMWNVVGWQGSELEKYVEPVYMSGIITSSQLPLISLYRTLYGRTVKFSRPESWCKNYPSPTLQKTTFNIAHVLKHAPQHFKRAHYLAFVWYISPSSHKHQSETEGTLEALDSRVGTVVDSVYVKKEVSQMGQGANNISTETCDVNASLSHPQVSSMCPKCETCTPISAPLTHLGLRQKLNEAPSTPSLLCPKLMNQLAHQTFDKFAASLTLSSYSSVKKLLQEYCEKEMKMGRWIKLRRD